MKAKHEQKPSVASMINLGLRSTNKVVANYTAALSKSKTPATPAATQRQDQRKSQ